MKYSLSSRCSPRYLKQADEIRVEWRDRREIPDFPEKYPSLDILLQFTPSQIQDTIPWDEVNDYSIICQGKFICACRTIEECKEAKSRGIRFYYGYEANSLSEIKALKELGCECVKVGPGLFFNMDKVKEMNMPVRLVPNIAWNTSFMENDNGIHGVWVRPEDISLYEECGVAYIEFENCRPTQEEAMFRIYGLGQGWKTDLKDLITGLEASAYNPMLEGIGERRIKCGHKCQYGKCNFCELRFGLADYEKLENYIKNMEEKANG